MMKRLRRYLVAGILVWLPLGITILLAGFIVRQMDRTIALIPQDYQPGVLLQQLLGTEEPILIPGFGVILTIILLLITGVLTANFVGRSFVKGSESLMDRIPIARSIYSVRSKRCCLSNTRVKVSLR